MNRLPFIIGLLISTNLLAQSPYLNIELKMDKHATEYTKYRISMKICDPLKMTDKGSWFTRDTSHIDYLSLKPSDFNCGEYSYIEGTDDYAGKAGTKFNLFEFGKQIFDWEGVLIFRIANYSSRAWWPEMYVVLPMKYKAFVTKIELTDLPFESGKVIYLSDPAASYSGESNHLSIQQSLSNEKLIDENKFPLKELLPKHYK